MHTSSTRRRHSEQCTGAIASPIGWIAHAGLAHSRPGGAPSRATLDEAIRAGVDWVECDLRLTADNVLVLRHDASARWTNVSDLHLAELRDLDADLLTLDEAVEHVGGRARLMLDVKQPQAADILARWLAKRRDRQNFAVTGRWLSHFVAASGRRSGAERWPSFPDPDGLTAALQDLPTTVATILHPHRALEALTHVRTCAATVGRGDLTPILRLACLPWRNDLPRRVVATAATLRAAGVCIHHRFLTPELVAAVDRLGLPVAAWTVNRRADLAHAIGCGASLMTTDRVLDLRRDVARRDLLRDTRDATALGPSAMVRRRTERQRLLTEAA